MVTTGKFDFSLAKSTCLLYRISQTQKLKQQVCDFEDTKYSFQCDKIESFVFVLKKGAQSFF